MSPTRVFTIYVTLLQLTKARGLQGLFAALCISGDKVPQVIATYGHLSLLYGAVTAVLLCWVSLPVSDLTHAVGRVRGGLLQAAGPSHGPAAEPATRHLLHAQTTVRPGCRSAGRPQERVVISK